MNSTIFVLFLTAMLSSQAQAAVSFIQDTSSGAPPFGSQELLLSGGFSRYDLTPGLSYLWTRSNPNDLDYELEADTVSWVERDRSGVIPRNSFTYPAGAAGTAAPDVEPKPAEQGLEAPSAAPQEAKDEGEFSFKVEYKF